MRINSKNKTGTDGEAKSEGEGGKVAWRTTSYSGSYSATSYSG